MPLSAGQILNNRYRIETLLGQGGFGAVYKAWDETFECWCALKENLDATPEAQRQFKREAQILFGLANPNLPRVTNYFVIPDPSGGGGTAYLVMDFVEGQDLEHMLQLNGGPLPEAQVVAWMAQICDALEYLHSQQPPVIHRDIKPANIKVTPAGKAMLVDFGIAKLFDPNLRTSVGARAYTSGYSPPEQYGRGVTDAQSDIYALGATAYHLLTGRLPPDSMDIVSGNTAPLRPAHELNPAVSPPVSAALSGAMELNKANRWRSVAEFKAALKPSPPVPLPSRESGVPATAVVQPARPYAQTLPLQAAEPSPAGRKRPWVWVGLGGLGLAGLAMLGLVIWGLSSLFGGKPALTPKSSPLALTTTARLTEPVAIETTTTRGALLTAMVATQPALQGLLASTQTALVENSAAQTVVAEEAATRAAAAQITDTPQAQIIGPKGVPMVLIPAGEFQMGSDNGGEGEKPVHTASLDAFYMDVYEVTNARYAACVSSGACQLPTHSKSYSSASYYGDPQYADDPVIYVTWQMANTYCEWRGGSLPTEAQWEKAARGGLQGMDYPWGNEQPVCDKGAGNGANFRDCTTQDTKPVGSYSPNGYGLYDMAGNVWEWVADWYQSDYYNSSPTKNPTGPGSGDYKALRGGGWYSDTDHLRVASRYYDYGPDISDYFIGFRCAAPP